MDLAFSFYGGFTNNERKRISIKLSVVGSNSTSFLYYYFDICICYHWFPGYIFPKLGYFPWWCLINQNSTVLSQLTGPSGLAMGLISLNWYRYLFLSMSPLTQPWWACANMIFGFVLVGWILIPVLYYSNVVNWSNLPIIGSDLYLAPNDKNNVQFSAAAAIVLYVYFGVFIALFVHTFLYQGCDIRDDHRATFSYPALTEKKKTKKDTPCPALPCYSKQNRARQGTLQI
jgi:hypothetical protein